jgi:hypothetical protein
MLLLYCIAISLVALQLRQLLQVGDLSITSCSTIEA